MSRVMMTGFFGVANAGAGAGSAFAFEPANMGAAKTERAPERRRERRVGIGDESVEDKGVWSLLHGIQPAMFEVRDFVFTHQLYDAAP